MATHLSGRGAAAENRAARSCRADDALPGEGPGAAVSGGCNDRLAFQPPVISVGVELSRGEVMACALIDRLAHHCHIVNIRGNSYRRKRHRHRAASAACERPLPTWLRPVPLPPCRRE